MKIVKPINNNIVTALDKQGREIVAMGRGIGYKAKAGGALAPADIEKIFRMEDQTATNRLTELLAQLPLEHIEICDRIISYARQTLETNLNPNIYITLTDHISFSLQRHQRGIVFKNPLMWEVRRIYRPEYQIGEYALALIEEHLGVRLVDDEAASIALHLVNAEYDTSMSDARKITQLIDKSLSLVQQELEVTLDEASIHYQRFVTHLRFLAQCLFKNEQLEEEETGFAQMITQQCPREYACAQSVGNYILQQFGKNLSGSELVYLTVHIKRVTAEHPIPAK